VKPSDLRDLSYEELKTKLAESKQELFNLRFQVATNQLDNTARIETVRHEVARIATVMREQEIEAFHQTKANRKIRTGIVVSDARDKTVTVEIVDSVRHKIYQKTMKSTKKLQVHDETNDAHVGDTVKVMETRPLSKTKRWRVVEIVERAR
jgi:small subunit ribosomal protein S17